MKLVGNYKVTKVIRKCGAFGLKNLQVGDVITVEFYVDGNGGNSPRVDLAVNGKSIGSKFAREVNELLVTGKKNAKWNSETRTHEDLPPVVELEEVTL